MKNPRRWAGGVICRNIVQLAVAILLVRLPVALAGSAALLALTVTALLLLLAVLLALVLPALLALLATLLLLLAILPFAIHALLALWLLLVLLRTVLTFLVLTHGASPSPRLGQGRSEEHTSELQSLMRISYAVFCLKKKNQPQTHNKTLI